MQTQSRGPWSKTQRFLPLAVGAAYLALLRVLLSTRAPSSASSAVLAAVYIALFFYAVGASILTIATFQHFREEKHPGAQGTHHSQRCVTAVHSESYSRLLRQVPSSCQVQ